MRRFRKLLQRMGWYRPDGFTLMAAPSARYDAWRIKGCHNAVINFGEHCIFEGRIDCDREGAHVSIGARTFVGDSHIISATNVTVGEDVLISWGVTIVDHDSHAIDFSQRHGDVMDWYNGWKNWSNVAAAPVTIKNKAWIGFGVAILKGVTIGEGAVVGAKSVVTRDVEPWTVVAGNPARLLRRLELSQ